MESKSAGMYNPPAKPPRPFAQDYPSGARADASGRLTHTIDGDPITARYVVGRRVVGGDDQAFPPAQLNALAEATTGRGPSVRPPREMGQDAGRVVLTRHGRIPQEVQIRRNLTPDQTSKVLAHELGHVIDELAGQIPSKGLADELTRVYNDLNRQDWRFARQERTGVPVAPKYRARPEDFGYARRDIAREYAAEAIRAYMVDPNYIKTVAPKTAEAIRKTFKPNPSLRDILQFNTWLPFTVLGGWAAGSDEPDRF